MQQPIPTEQIDRVPIRTNPSNKVSGNSGMPPIIVFSKKFFISTETFIYTQVSYLKQFFNIFLVAETYSDESKHDFSNLQQVELDQREKKIRYFFSKLLRRTITPQFQFQFHNQTQLKKLIEEKGIKLIHAHFGKDAMKVLPIAKRNGVPLVVTFHGYDASRLLANVWYKKNLPRLFDYASKIIVVSKHMIAKLDLQQWQEKVLLLPYSIDVEEFKPFEQVKKDDKISLLHLGRLVNKKGVPDLIRVFANLYKINKRLHLTVAGSGPELNICRSEAENLGVQDAVSFLGEQPHAEVKNILNATDIFILNSRTADDGDMEGTPVTLLEAMSLGRAVVSTYHAGIPDVIQDNYNGRLVPEKNNEKLEEAILDLIEDKEKRKRLGEKARQTIVSKFSYSVNLPVLRNTLMEIANKSSLSKANFRTLEAVVQLK